MGIDFGGGASKATLLSEEGKIVAENTVEYPTYYAAQVGLTGRTVAPPVYIAVGISGAVHHVAGMSRAGTVITINSDKNAPIFEYADFGVLEEF